MSFFQKKPVVVEARQLTDNTFDEIVDWINSCRGKGSCYQARSSPLRLVIQTLEGDHNAAIGDWIIKGVRGEFYPCKPDIFEMTYETHPIP